jgi:hypothetical protein
MSGFVFHPAALTDLTEIWQHIAANNPDAADRVLEEVRENAFGCRTRRFCVCGFRVNFMQQAGREVSLITSARGKSGLALRYG